jgi:hypothetical protein
MFSRRTIATIAAAFAVFAGGTGIAPGTEPERAEAALNCSTIRFWDAEELHFSIRQANGYILHLEYRRNRWVAYSYDRNYNTHSVGYARFASITPELVKFTITWGNGSSGIYTGSADDDGYVSGTARDRWNRNSRTRWHMPMPAECA